VSQPQLVPNYPAQWEADALLADGGTVFVRPILPTDAPAILALHARLSKETVYLRFFSALPTLSPTLLERFTHVDYVDRLAFVALLGEEIVAVARYDRIPGGDEAEVAFVVDDAHQGRGLGTLLLEHLAAAAKEAGIRRFVAETLPHNQRMLHVFRDAGWRTERSFSEGVVRVVFPIEPTEESVGAMHERERRAAAASVARLLRPRTIAVVGASRRPGTVGNVLLRNLVTSGFTGPVYPVNPSARSVGAVRAYPSVVDIPDEVDLAVLAVPADEVPRVIEGCASKRVGGLVVVSAGFAETGPQGAQAEHQLVRTARRNGMRVVGPACMGVANTDPAISMNATIAPEALTAGRVSLMAQSGPLGLAILTEARRRGLGVASFVSAGNKADVSGNDLLQYWEDDPGTDVVLLYLESFGNPRTFARVARRVSRVKPIVAVKSGRGLARPAGSGMAPLAGSRTAPATRSAPCRCQVRPPSPDAGVEALFHRTGVVRVDTLEQLFDVARGLVSQPLPAGRRVAVVGNVGGPVPLAVDTCEGAGLEVAPLTEDTTRRLAGASGGPLARVTNPVLLPGTAPARDWEATLSAVLADPGVDAVLALFVPAVVDGGEGAHLAGWKGEPGAAALESARAVAGAVVAATARQEGRPKPVLANFLTLPGLPASLGGGPEVIPAFPFPETAARVLSRMADYAEWRARPVGQVPELEGLDRQAAHDLTTSALAHPSEVGVEVEEWANQEGVWLDESAARALLASYGIATAPAEDQVGSGTGDLVAGVFQDQSLGSLATLAAKAAGPVGQPVVRLLPVTDMDAAELIAAMPFVHSDPASLQELLLRLGRLVEHHPEVAEVHLDPIRVGPAGAVVPQPCVRVAPWHPHPELALRRLR
jgi:acyl-CoA synthetase (NDP forming)/RimJ/RimL family protein N-acetyltransferase